MIDSERKQLDRMAAGMAELRAEVRRLREFADTVAGGPGRKGFVRLDEWEKHIREQARQVLSER